MGTNVFYNMIKEYAESLIKQRPDCASTGNNAICAIFTSKHDIFTGITDISQSVSAEYLAINAMCDAGQTKARQMITILLSDFSVVKPNVDGIIKLIETDSENGKCEVFVSKNESVKAIEITKNAVSAESKADEFFSGFDGQGNETELAGKNAFQKMGIVSEPDTEKTDKSIPSELGAPADFSNGFDIDVTNPFYEAPAEDKEVATIASASADKPVNTLGGNTGNSNKAPVMSKDELLKQAKKKKKIAKNIFSAKRK